MKRNDVIQTIILFIILLRDRIYKKKIKISNKIKYKVCKKIIDIIEKPCTNL